MLDFMIATPKGTSLRGTVLWHILRQNRSRGLGCSELQEPPKNGKKTNTFWCAKSRMRRNETPGRIVTNFGTGVGVHDIITSANFYDCRLWGLSVVGGQILGFSMRVRDVVNIVRTCFYIIHFQQPVASHYTY